MMQQSTGDWVAWNDCQEVIRRSRTLQAVGIYRNAILDLAGSPSTPPEALYGLRMTSELFPMLGVSPMLGRNILQEEDQPGHADVMILSYGLWARRFNSDPKVLGRTVTVNGRASTVIGVMPPGFNFPLRRSAVHTPSPYVEFWAPISGNTQGGLGAVARLRPGATLEQARQEVASISEALALEFPNTNRDLTLRLNLIRDRIVGSAGNGLMMLMAAALLFMLIGCANVANLLLARGLVRHREIAVRLALGAGSGRIVRQILTESCVLALLGGVGGYLLTAAAWKVLPLLAPVSIPRLAAARADSTVLGFALAIGVLNGILFGMAPALRLARGQAALDGFGVRGVAPAGRDRLRSSLVMAEVSLSVVLVVSGGHLLSCYTRLIATDPGFQPDGLLASVVLPAPERYENPEARAVFYKRILDAVRALPGVESAGTVDALPFSGENNGGIVSSGEAAAAQPVESEIDVTGGDYLQTMGLQLLEGRWFHDEEMSTSSDSAIVSAFVARRLWPGTSALGRPICVHCTPENPRNWKRVIGVVSDSRHAALDEREKGSVYLAAGAMQRSAFLVVRTNRPPGEMQNAIRHAIARIDPHQPVFLSASMRDFISDSVADRRFIMNLLVITGCLALAMAAAGVYGVIAYTTSRRTAEIGIRMAVGAAPRDVLSLIFRQGFRAVAVGLALGICASLLALPYLRSVVVGFESGHPASIWIATCLVTITAGVACWFPARKATRTDPISALRHE